MLVVDSHPIVSGGIEVSLKRAFGEVVVRSTSDMLEASDICHFDQPNLVLADLMLPGADPLPAMNRILMEYPEIKFIVFTALKSQACAAEAIRFGASGYILKSCGLEDMVSAVEQVLLGGVYIDPALDEQKIVSNHDTHELSVSEKELTRRERQVLKLIADGMRNREIAAMLHISPKTVDCHRQRLMQKLGAHNVASVIRWAYQSGYADIGALKK
ncbi:LuxR C-terminal-related transcriptional regulator [Burkholderia pyrrocinia]